MNGEKVLSLQTVVTEMVSNILSGVHTAIPAIIDSYDHSTMLCNARPSINTTFEDGVVVATPMIYNVPVLFPRSRFAAITFPLERGDSVLLVFSERSLDEWISNGGTTTPDDPRRHDMSDAVAIPGCFHSGAGKLPTNNEDMEIQYRNQSITIKQNGNVITGNTQSKVQGSHCITNAASVELGGETSDPTDGVVTGKCACMAFGSPHAIVSPVVKAKFTP